MMSYAPLVVVVDDDDAVLKALGRVLRAAGFDTATYSSAEAFLTAPPARRAHCLLLDVQLGGMSGLDLQRHLRAHGSTLPVIILTAFDDDAVRAEACAAGCAGYFDKQTDVDVLLRLIKSCTPFDTGSAKAL
jgi:FixJ family two-component response regulator